YIGGAVIAVRSKGGCLMQLVQTNSSGFANNIVLPKREISIEVTNITPTPVSGLDENDILSEIGGEMLIDLDTTINLEVFYRKPLSIDFIGIPSAPCPAVSDPLFEQAIAYPITIQVWESPGICPVDSGYVAIQNNISSVGLETSILDTVPISNGVAQYIIVPGEPVLNAPYLKNITFTAVVDDSITTSQTISGIVSGSRQRTQTFVTGAPTELPYLILRDPPGDASFSFFDQNASTTYAQSYSALAGGDVRLWAKAKTKVPLFGVKILGSIGGGITVGGSRLSKDEIKTTLSHNLNIKTSAEQTDVGPDFDIVYGSATNFIYGLADECFFDVNTCEMIVDTNLVFSPDTFETEFLYTIGDIRDDIIPQLELAANNPDTTEDARRKFANELRKWEQVIQYNEELKEDALRNPITNYSLSTDLGPVTRSTTGSSSVTKSIEFKTILNFDFAASLGVELLGGLTTVQGGVEANIRGEWGEAFSSTITETTTTGFTFDDNGPRDNDLVSFDYAIDPVYGTPVFGDPIGKTSCPHEVGTQFIDLPQIVALEPVKYAADGEDELVFPIAIRNYSESGETRLYNIDYIEGDGSAVVSFGGQSLTGVLIPRTLGPNEENIIFIKVEPNIAGVYSFEGIELRMYPACQTGLYSSTFINAYFSNDCPYVTMPLPEEQFFINSNDNNMMGVVMDDYIVDPDVDYIKLLYTPIGETNWQDAGINIPGGNLLAPPQNYFWDVSNLEDGEYSIRWELKCGTTINTSTRVTGTIDRSVPRVFGNERPYDDTYFPGDEISVTFNEFIDILTLQNGNFFVKDLTTDQSIIANVSADDKKVIIDLGVNIDSLYNHSFEVGLIHVQDMNNNARPDTITWQFLVSEPDSDRDGIGDLTDRCPGGDDCEDADMDGIPDDCDCLPTIPQNGKELSKAAMHFDGFNDFISVPYNAAFIPTSSNSVTYETWIFPKESTNEHGFIACTGNFPNRNQHIYYNNASKKILVSGIDVSLLISNSTVPTDEWTHIAVVYDQTQTILYINGELDKVRNQALSSTDLMNNLTIGNQASGGPTIWNFNGLIEEFRVWNTARTEAEIKSNMRKELLGTEAGLELYFDFNEGIPFGDNSNESSIIDQSENGYVGTPNTFDKLGTTSNWAFSPQGLINATYKQCLNCPDTLNGAIDLDGIDDNLIIANNPNIVPTTSNEMTFELWLYPADSSANNVEMLARINGNLFIQRFPGA
ncbi:MAG: LamG-like jellyroll fold domain-containing protein, partial [Bacteroidota bacterium]